jgi:hypothetical protein
VRISAAGASQKNGGVIWHLNIKQASQLMKK